MQKSGGMPQVETAAGISSDGDHPGGHVKGSDRHSDIAYAGRPGENGRQHALMRLHNSESAIKPKDLKQCQLLQAPRARVVSKTLEQPENDRESGRGNDGADAEQGRGGEALKEPGSAQRKGGEKPSQRDDPRGPHWPAHTPLPATALSRCCNSMALQRSGSSTGNACDAPAISA